MVQRGGDKGFRKFVECARYAEAVEGGCGMTKVDGDPAERGSTPTAPG